MAQLDRITVTTDGSAAPVGHIQAASTTWTAHCDIEGCQVNDWTSPYLEEMLSQLVDHLVLDHGIEP